MDHKLKRKWVNALRGGNYTQCFCAFEKEGKYCALGVLTDIGRKLGLRPLEIHGSLTRDQRMDVMLKNDCFEDPFPIIADWIEENV